MEVYFWHRILSPHMTPLAQSLCEAGINVTVVYSEEHSAERKALGWLLPNTSQVRVCYEPKLEGILNIANSASADSVHICEGFRNNGFVSEAQSAISSRNLTQFVIMETVRPIGIKGIFRNILYNYLIWRRRNDISGVLAIGANTPNWLAERGVPKSNIFPFTYFLTARRPFVGRRSENKEYDENVNRRTRVLFVGRLISLKGVDILFNSLANVSGRLDLGIIGVGPEDLALRQQAEKLPKNIRTIFMGRRSMSEIQEIMSEADFLVLPSRQDGWGAVVSEALMVGTPVICSDACGASEVVCLSGVGGVFKSCNVGDLSGLITKMKGATPISDEKRADISDWASALDSEAGARYLMNIISYNANKNEEPKPVPPWRLNS